MLCDKNSKVANVVEKDRTFSTEFQQLGLSSEGLCKNIG